MNYLESWMEEKRSAWIYKVVAANEHDLIRRGLFENLSKMAEQQALIWAQKMTAAGMHVPQSFQPDLRAYIVAKLVQWFGPRQVRSILAAMKIRGLSTYTEENFAHPKIHSIEDLEKHHKDLRKGGNLRAAIFGINDGLISNASLIFGMAGAITNNNIILLAGVAGLLAGAFSMAAGEYISVHSQREIYEYQIGLEREELENYPEEEAEELALIYAARGLSITEARTMANKILANPEAALQTLSKEELGLDPRNLGSPMGAAFSSFTCFALGAFIPLLPYTIAIVPSKLVTAITLTAISLLAVGAIISLFTGRRALWSSLRMLLIGGCSGMATYFIGKLIGVTMY